MAETEGATVKVAVEDGIAVVTVDNPPVNAISQAIRHGLIDAMAEIERNPSITAAIIIGADIDVFYREPPLARQEKPA